MLTSTLNFSPERGFTSVALDLSGRGGVELSSALTYEQLEGVS